MTDGNPVIFKKTKAKPAQRARDRSPDAIATGPDFTATGGEDSPINLATKLKNRVKKAQPRSRLSFGGDDEESDGEAFQVKKSTLSRKLALGSHPSSPRNTLPATLDQASISPRPSGGPTYDKAHLSELKASTPTTRPSIPGYDPYDADMSMDADISIQDISTLDVFNEPVTSILSDSSIKNAKQKRQRLRETANERNDDFISLSVTKRGDEHQGPHPESRLMREDDDLGDGDDEFAEYTSAQERIALGKKSKKKEANKRRQEMKEMIVDVEDDEEDEDAAEWAQEQARRGGQFVGDLLSRATVKQTYKPSPIPSLTQIPTLGPAVARLTRSLTALTTSHATNTVSMSSVTDECATIESREMELRAMIDKAEAKRAWFVAFREWVESVATFLDEKFPSLENLEDEHMSIIKERSDMISQRRQLDDEDDLSAFLGSPPTLAQSGSKIDEINGSAGNTNTLKARQDRRAARSARRIYRRARSQVANEDEGYSTDSSLPPTDAADYKAATSKVSLGATVILSDVRAEGFKDPSKGIGKWFSEWRDKWGDSYMGAWGGLGLVGAWEFWVRLEILGWNPLEDARSLDSFSWYLSLYEYSRPPVDDDDEDPELGPDGDLVSAMISTAIIPRLCKIIECGAFDPYSATGLRRMLDLVEQVEAYVNGDNAKFQTLLKSAYTAFLASTTAVTSLLEPYIALQNPRFDPEAIPARLRFLARRIKLLKNILRWRKYTGEKFGIGELAVRLVTRCIMPVAESGWEVGGEDAARKIVLLLPDELFPIPVKTRMMGLA